MSRQLVAFDEHRKPHPLLKGTRRLYHNRTENTRRYVRSIELIGNQCHEITVRATVMRELKIAMTTRLICMIYDLALV